MTGSSRTATKRVVFLSALLPLLVVSACGTDQKAESDAWINEVLLVNGGFMETAKQGTQAIASAQNADQLSAAYSSYAADLRQQLAKFEDVDAPDACADEQAAMESFMTEAIGFAEKLSDQENLTRASVKQLEAQAAEAASKMLAALKPTLSISSC
jgi:hypothetical protein